MTLYGTETAKALDYVVNLNFMSHLISINEVNGSTFMHLKLIICFQFLISGRDQGLETDHKAEITQCFVLGM